MNTVETFIKDKCKSEFEAILNGDRAFDIVLEYDKKRGIKKGDIFVFKEVIYGRNKDNLNEEIKFGLYGVYTGRQMTKTVSYVCGLYDEISEESVEFYYAVGLI